MKKLYLKKNIINIFKLEYLNINYKYLTFNRNIKLKLLTINLIRINIKKKKNLCFFTDRHKGLVKLLNISRHSFNKQLKLNNIQNLLLSSW